jgi:phospholipid/cholesterol/gamma-HCH transport system substrate-binding protein
MRRSVREALVGFSLLAAVAGGLGLWFWLKGISLTRGNWTIQASFQDAAGLAKRSPVSFRGVLVGRVRSIKVNAQEVLADLEITDPSLRLARPVVARVGAASLLGGDAMVSLLSAGPPQSLGGPGPLDRGCDNSRMVCDRGRVRGVEAPTLDSVTTTMQKLLDQADQERLVKRLALATDAFDKTAEETRKLAAQGQAFVGDAQTLVKGLNGVVGKTDPIVQNITAASVDARQASRSVKQLAGRLDQAKTVNDLQATLANARRLTQRWEAVGGDVQKLTGDPSFVAGMRSVSVGLGRFFDDLYPGTAPAGGASAGRREGNRSRSGEAGGPQPGNAAAGSSSHRDGAEARAVDSARPAAIRARPHRPDPADRFAPRTKAPAMPVPAYGFEAPAP